MRLPATRVLTNNPANKTKRAWATPAMVPDIAPKPIIAAKIAIRQKIRLKRNMMYLLFAFTILALMGSPHGHVTVFYLGHVVELARGA